MYRVNIPEILKKIKGYLRYPSADLIVVCVVILVGSAGFGLGRLSVLEGQKEAVPVLYPEQMAGAAAAGQGNFASSQPAQAGGEVVASKNGSKYHFPWCPGAAQIAEKNKITFASAEEARVAGYTPAANCKGLE